MFKQLDATFSITGWCPKTNDVGIAISTARIAVGQRCPYAKVGVGAICTQSSTNPRLGIAGLKLLELGISPEDALNILLTLDEKREKRQVAAVDYRGQSFGYTGSECIEWAGHITGPGYVAAGNILVSAETIEAMSHSFKNSVGLPLSERLLRSLENGQNAGGDKRGRISAALLVASRKPEMFHNIRVDDSNEPVNELRRIYNKILK